MDPNAYLQILWRRKLLFAAVLGTCLAVALAIVCFAGKIYRVRADFRLVLTPLEIQLIPSISTQFGRFNYADPRFEYAINTAAELLKSRKVAGRVIEELKLQDGQGKPVLLDDFSDVNIVQRLLNGKTLSVEQVTDAEVFQVRAYSRNQQEAGDIAAKAIEAFAAEWREKHRGSARIAMEALRGRIRITDEQVRKLEQELANKRIEQFNLDLDSESRSVQLTAYLERYMTAEQDLDKLERSHEAALASRKVLEELKKRVPEFRKATETLQRDPLYDSYRSQLLTQTIEYAQLRTEFTENHPDVKATAQSIEKTRAGLEELSRKTFGQSSMSRNTDFDHLTATLLDTEVDLGTYEASRRIISDEIKRLRERLLKIPRIQEAFLSPSRELESLQSEWTDLFVNLEALQTAMAVEFSNVHVIRPAVINSDKPKEDLYFPRKALTLALALFVGVLSGLIAVYTVDAVDNRLQTAEEFARHIEVPLLGVIPRYFLRSLRPLKPGDGPLNLFNNLRLRVSAQHRRPAVIAVSGIGRKDGASTVAALLASASARSGARTLLIEANLRSPSLGSRLKMPGKPAGEVLASPESLKAAIAATSLPNLDVAAAQPSGSPAVSLIEQMDWAAVLGGLREEYDLVVVDLPAAEVGLEAVFVGQAADVVLVVAGAGRYSPNRVRHALSALTDAGVHVSGIVPNRVV